jgi:hypothetical protein
VSAKIAFACVYASIVLAVLADNAANAQERPTQTGGLFEALPAHTPPSPPPKSSLRPQIELLSVPRGIATAYPGPLIDVLTYHYNNSRSGWNPYEVQLTPAKVASSEFSLLKTLKVDGNVFAQPLLISGFPMPDGVERDLLIIVSGHNNTVYAFDANTFAPVWPATSMGPSQNTADIGCKDVVPEYGITSTPVIVRKSKDNAILYLVTATEPRPKEFHTYLNALDLKTGTPLRQAVEIAPSATLLDGSTLNFDSQEQWSRAGLAYNNGSIYVSIGSHCDNHKQFISGWVLRYDENFALKAMFHTFSGHTGGGLGSIWMTGFAPAIDDDGYVFVVTGNGDDSSGPPSDYSESVIKLDGQTLEPKDYFKPYGYSSSTPLEDVDFGSGGVVLFDVEYAGKKRGFAAAIGKDPTLHILDKENLGKLQPNDLGAYQLIHVKACPFPGKPCALGVNGGPSEFLSKNGLTLFVQAQADYLQSYRLNDLTHTFAPTGQQGSTKAGYNGSIPVVSSNGAVNGIVWLLRRYEPIELEAYDADALGAPICSANVGNWSNPDYGIAGNSFLTPIVANGKVYAAAWGIVKIFGLASGGGTAETRACDYTVQALQQ